VASKTYDTADPALTGTLTGSVPQSPQSYTLTLTAISGALQHSTTFSLTIQ
jgi:hypothetical protein